ncbi:MAG: phosphoglucosamine mutase [Acidimicrobiaceae bacterium]|nr:phosphoglucosamine mutase [Acidimicrobiaceae bacterium]
MVRQLFGTDGVRGRAGQFLTADLALQLARTVVACLDAPRPQVLIIRDTRESSEMLESAMAAGVAAAGGDAWLAGVQPTPAAPHLLLGHGLDLAAVITASHNPYEDNGIKLFASDGFKLDDDTEHAIEAELETSPPPPAHIGRVQRFDGALEDYLGRLQERFRALDLNGTRVLLDCANGATFQAAPEIFRRLGAAVEVIANEPDGININRDCGSTHLGAVIKRVKGGSYDVAFAFDGDGDRVMAVDRTGAVADGDDLMALAAVHLRSQGRLAGNGVAVTVMTNYGFHRAMEAAGIEVATTAVGDRYVVEELRQRGWVLGGEAAGHILDLGFGTSGDGIASALLTLEALGGRDLAHGRAMDKLPQRMVNLRAHDRSRLAAVMADPGVEEATARENAALEGRGRVLVRASGTEPLIRVMAEAPSEQETAEVCERLRLAVETALAKSGDSDPAKR